MFDYPLSLPRDTDYDLLSLGPEATTDEVNEAIMEYSRQMTTEKQSIEARLSSLYERVPKLERAIEKLQSLRSAGADKDPGAIAAAERELNGLEQQASLIEPEFRRWRDYLQQFTERNISISKIPLQNPADRAKYDQAHPPFSLLKLEEPAVPDFADRATVLPLLRRELVAFLASRGAEVFHPSDLTRDDFSGDFQYHALLDGQRS